jgi:hypothetical protein
VKISSAISAAIHSMIKHRIRAPGHPSESRDPAEVTLGFHNGIPRLSLGMTPLLSAGRPNLIRPARYYYEMFYYFCDLVSGTARYAINEPVAASTPLPVISPLLFMSFAIARKPG